MASGRVCTNSETRIETGVISCCFVCGGPAKTGEQKHEELRKLLVEDLLRARPQLTSEEAKKLIDDF